VKTGMRWVSALLGSSHGLVRKVGMAAAALLLAFAGSPAQAQSVSDLLNSLFGQPQSEKRSAPVARAKPRAEPRPEPRADRSEPRSEPQRRAEPAKNPERVGPVAITPTGLPVTPGEPQLAVVTLGTQSLKFYSGGRLIETAPISSGAKDHRTPTGVFTVIERHRDHESNIYESAPMPFMHRLTWSGIALHQGVLPGNPASHGCIRLPKQFVERLWEVSKIGMRVIVSPAPVDVAAVSSPLLFTPKFTAVPDDIVAYLTPERAAGTSAAPTTLAEAKPDAASASVKSDAGPAAMLPAVVLPTKPKLKLNAQQIAALKTSAAGATSLNPMQAGVVERIRAQALAPIAQKAADEALAASAAASAKANEALAELRLAEAALKAAKAKVGDVGSTPAVLVPVSGVSLPPMAMASTTDVPAVIGVWSTVAAPSGNATASALEPASQEAKARLDAQRLVLKSKVRLDAAMADDAVKSPAAFAAAEAARKALAVADDAQAASKVSAKRSSPISVLISGKEQRLYVRQGLNPVFDAPVIVRPGPEPIGTHAFQAVSSTGEALNWITVSVATETLSDDVRYSKALRAALTTKPAGDAVDPSIGAAAALRALERFDLGAELSEKLSELVWVGAWIIVSEHPLSKETGGIGTDLVVLTK
jgi:lipoprotein-anchoring transpeptidase ErfK/SrfK